MNGVSPTIIGTASRVFGPGRTSNSRNPNQTGIICPAAVMGEIPVITAVETSGVAVEKSELCAVVVQIGVDVVLLRDRGELAVVEEPND